MPPETKTVRAFPPTRLKNTAIPHDRAIAFSAQCGPPPVTSLWSKTAEHDPLGTCLPSGVPAPVHEPGTAVGGQARRVRFIDGKNDAGLCRMVPGRKFFRGGHGGGRREWTEPPPLFTPVDQEAPEEPRRVVVRPACQARRPGLQGEYTHGPAGGRDNIGPARVLGKSGEGHAERIANKPVLSWPHFESCHCLKVDGAGVVVEVLEGNQPDTPTDAVQDCGPGESPSEGDASGGPAGSIQKTSQRCPSGSWKLWLYIKP